MTNWVRIGSDQRIAGRINLDVAPLCVERDGRLWLYLLDVGTPLPLPRRAPDPSEKAAFQRIRRRDA